MRLFLPVFNYVCMLILSVLTATFVYTSLFMPPEVGLSYVEMTSLFMSFLLHRFSLFYTAILRGFEAVTY